MMMLSSLSSDLFFTARSCGSLRFICEVGLCWIETVGFGSCIFLILPSIGWISSIGLCLVSQVLPIVLCTIFLCLIFHNLVRSFSCNLKSLSFASSAL